MPTRRTKTPDVTGYDTQLRYLATRFRQGGRTVYSLNLSLDQVRSLVSRPNHEVSMPGNRAIRLTHAEGFAKYIRTRPDWVSPGMIFRAPAAARFEFDALEEIEGASFGQLSFPRSAARDVAILDGQHRTLGFYIADEQIGIDLENARNTLAAARRSSGEKSAEAREAQKRIDALLLQRERLATERISIDLYIEDDPIAFRQMFVDIADNALGITASVKARFDSTKVVNRALEAVMEHPLLRGRVDIESDHVRRGSAYLMSARHVTEIIRCAVVGIDGRISKQQEVDLKDATVVAVASDTLDLMVECFPALQMLTNDLITPQGLRETSLLGSLLFFRGIVGVIHELRSDRHRWTRDMVAEFLKKLPPHVTGADAIPVHRDTIWIEHMPEGIFFDGASAPASPRQSMRRFVDTVTDWALDRRTFLDAKPKPRPQPTEEELALEALAAEEKAAARAAERQSPGYLAATRR